MPIKCIERFKDAQHRWADRAIARMDAKDEQKAAEKQSKQAADDNYRATHTHDTIGRGEYSDDPRT